MTINPISDCVRIVYLGSSRTTVNDVLVEVMHPGTTEWKLYIAYDSMSDDYAYTNARETATALAKTMLKKQP